MNETDGIRTTNLQIEGMGCSCEGQIVEKRVRALKGVHEFSLNPITNRMMVSYDPEVVTLKDIQKAVKKAGMKAVLT